MASTPSESTSAAAPLSASQRAAIWHELVKIASSLANKQLDAFATRLANALLSRTAGLAADEAQLRADASALLKKNRYLFYYVASERLGAALQREVQAIEGPSQPGTETDNAKRLAPDLEMDKKLSLLKASREIENEHANRLAVLNSRLAYLVGCDELPTAQNPFRPHIFLSSLHEAWCEFHPDANAHHLAFRLMGTELCIDVGPILHALNAELVKRGILSTLSEPVHQAPAAKEQQAATDDPVTQQLRRLFPTTAANAGMNADRPLEGDLPSLFGNTALHSAVSRNELLTYLAGIQKNGPDPQQFGTTADGTQGTSLLAHIKRWAPPESLEPSDVHAIDLLTTVFDVVFSATDIPAPIKILIGSLQIPVLKATLSDKDFFFRQAHPARRMIELLAQMAMGWDPAGGPRDPLYQTILRNVKRIQSDQRIPAFSEAVEELESFIAEQEAGTAEALSQSIEQALVQEKRVQAAKAAKHEVALRVGSGEVVAFVETFLEDKWVSVLTLAYAAKDDKPQALDSAIKTMDDLCWSVKPKITMEERKNLLAKLPNIIALLNKWLDLIKWNDEARLKFFDDLAKCHASIVRAPLELSPERQMKIAVAVAKKAAERRLQRQASQQPEPAPDAFDEQVKRLACGSWVEFTRNYSTPMKLKLAWASPMRSLFIFSARDKRETLSISDEVLAQSLREGRAKIVLEAGLVARALEQALTAESANNAGLDGEAAA